MTPGISTLDLPYVTPQLDGTLKMERGTTPAAVNNPWPFVGATVLWKRRAGQAVPTGWAILTEVDGISLDGRFPKIATSDEEVGTTGGSDEVSIDIDHNHPPASASLSVSASGSGTTGDADAEVDVASTDQQTVAERNHGHPFSVTVSGTATGNVDIPALGETLKTVEIDPPWVKFYLLEYVG